MKIELGVPFKATPTVGRELPLEFNEGRGGLLVERVLEDELLTGSANLPVGPVPLRLMTNEEGKAVVDPDHAPLRITVAVYDLTEIEIELYQARIIHKGNFFEGEPDYDPAELEVDKQARLSFWGWWERGKSGRASDSYFPGDPQSPNHPRIFKDLQFVLIQPIKGI